MPQITAKEALIQIKDKIGEGTEILLVQIAGGIEQAAQLATSAATPLPDITEVLATTQAKIAELTGLKEQAETGLGDLTDVIARLGLANEVIFAVEDEPKPQKLIIDPFQKVVIRGEVVGEIPENNVGLQAVDILARASKPLSQSEVAARIKFTAKGEWAKTGVKTYTLRSSIAEVNKAMEDQGLPRLIINLRGKGEGRGYSLGGYQIVGIDSQAAAETPINARQGTTRPETFSISQVLAMEGIAGVLSETQIRRITQQLLAKGCFKIGAEVMEGRAQSRGTSSEVVRDLKHTPAGVAVMRDIANQFGAQSRIHTDDIVEWLKNQKDQPVALLPQPADTGKRFYISQIAKQARIPETAMKTLYEIGVFKEGVHFEQKGRVKIYTDAALQIAQQVAGQAKKEKQERFTERLIRKAVGLPKEKNGENPYGPNGPRAITPEHERIILDRLQRCEPGIEKRLGKPLNEEFKLERDLRLGELTSRLVEDESLRTNPEEQQRIRREAAATVLELARDARKFNFVRRQHPGLEIALLVIKALDTKSVRDLAEAMVNPPRKVAEAIERNGVINRVTTVGPMGDE